MGIGPKSCRGTPGGADGADTAPIGRRDSRDFHRDDDQRVIHLPAKARWRGAWALRGGGGSPGRRQRAATGELVRVIGPQSVTELFSAASAVHGSAAAVAAMRRGGTEKRDARESTLRGSAQDEGRLERERDGAPRLPLRHTSSQSIGRVAAVDRGRLRCRTQVHA